jgi:polysaccharide export outer membrane protein
MTPPAWFSGRRRAIIGAFVATFALAGCATRHPESITPVAPVASGLIWKLDEGDIIRTKVYRSSDLDGETIVGVNGTAFFPGIGRMAVKGMDVDSLETLLNARYGALVRNAAVQVTMLRDITLYGQVRSPGVYATDPTITLLGLVARAGGPASASGAPDVTLEKSDGSRLALPREARLGSIDIRRTDAIYLADNSFFVRNGTTIQAASLVVTVISTLASVILIITR